MEPVFIYMQSVSVSEHIGEAGQNTPGGVLSCTEDKTVMRLLYDVMSRTIKWRAVKRLCTSEHFSSFDSSLALNVSL